MLTLKKNIDFYGPSALKYALKAYQYRKKQPII